MKISKARYAPGYTNGIEVNLSDIDGPSFKMVEGSVDWRDAPNRKVAEIDALIRYLTKWRDKALREYPAFFVLDGAPVVARHPFAGLDRWLQNNGQ